MSLEPEKLEFMLSQATDGTLSPEEQRMVEAAIAADPAMSQLVRRYERVAELLKRYKASVRIKNAALADSIRESIRQELQFQMSQDIDEQLTPAAAARLDHSLAGSLAQQRQDEDLRGVHSLLQKYVAAQPVPQMADLSSRIGAAVRRESVTQCRREAAADPRIIRWQPFVRVAAVAALIALAVLVWRHPWSSISPNGGNPTNVVLITPKVEVVINGPVQAGRIDIHFDRAEPEPEASIAEGPQFAPEGSIISSTRAARQARENANSEAVAALLKLRY